MKKRILFPIALVALIIFFVLFSPFWKWEDDNLSRTSGAFNNDAKQDFFVETQKFGDFPQVAQIKKIWKITGAQDINIIASISWRVSDILVKAGDSVIAGQKLVILSDNISNFATSVDRTANAIEAAQINFDSQKISLNKQILDAENEVDQLEANLIALTQTNNQNIQLAQNAVDNASVDRDNSKASLDIIRLDTEIERLKLNYDNLLLSDQQTLSGLDEDFQNFFNGYNLLLVDVTDFWDELFGISQARRSYNDDIENFLWAKNPFHTRETRELLSGMLGERPSLWFWAGKVSLADNTTPPEEVIESIDYILEGYNQLEILLNDLETVLTNSARSQWVFGETEINSLVATLNSFQSQIQNNNSALTTFTTNTKTFLNTYLKAQEIALKQIEIAIKDRDILLESLKNTADDAVINFENIVISQADQVKNLQIQLENAKNNLQTVRQNRELVLRNSANQISNAQINYNEASNNFSKLVITAPVSGTIGEVFVDIGQEINNGISILSLTSDGSKEISLWFSSDEIRFVSIGDEVSLESFWEQYNGTIIALSSVADANLNYKATVWFDADIHLLWDLVSVYVWVQTQYILVPLNIVDVIKPGSWFIKTLSGGVLQNNEVILGSIWWSEIEIHSQVDAGADIIINNISNYNPNKFNIKQK